MVNRIVRTHAQDAATVLKQALNHIAYLPQSESYKALVLRIKQAIPALEEQHKKIEDEVSKKHS